MTGFLDIPKEKGLPKLKREARATGCETCAAYKYCNTPKFPVVGKGKKRILLIFDSPTEKEDRTSRAFSSPEHQYLFSLLEKMGIDQDDVWITHAVQCYQSKFANKEILVSPQSVQGCHLRLKATIKRLQPERVLVFGSVAMKTLYQHVSSGRFSFATYAKFPGAVIPDQDYKTVVVPILNPRETLADLEYRRNSIKARKPEARFAKNLWEDNYLSGTDGFVIREKFTKKQLRAGLKAQWRNTTPPETKVLTGQEEIQNVIKYLMTVPKFAFDIETTGLKPFREEQEIYTWGFSDGKSIWAFRHPKDKRTLNMLRRLMASNVPKYGWNIQFENIWIKHFLGVWIKNWRFDGMIGTHILDNRPGITSLKFQTFVRHGNAGYDAEIDGFLDSADKSSHSLNQIKKAPIRRVLVYNGLDAWFTFHICEEMESEIKQIPAIQRGYELFHEGQIALSKMTFRGFYVDAILLEKNYIELDGKAQVLYKRIMEAKEVAGWTTFNPGSNADLIELFYKRIGYTVVEKTDRGQPSTKAEVLEGFFERDGLQIAKDIAEYKTILQSRDTFLAGIKRETWDNVIRPNYLLNLIRSYRSSSQSPNFQNLPKRDLKMMSYIKSVFKPRPGCVYLDIDYKSLEAYRGCDIHGDPTMTRYLMDESTDMHSDTAAALFKCVMTEDDPLFKKKRNVGKTANFAIQYGSSARMLAYNLWHGHMGNELKEYLQTVGIMNFEDWEKHCYTFYDDYWNVRFGELGSWRNRLWKEYVRNGVIYGLTGVMYNSLMTKNQLTNYPIQGPSFHLLLEGVITMTKELEERGMKTGFVGEIHDAIILEVPFEEIEEVKKMVEYHFSIRIKEKHKWVQLPLMLAGEIYRDNWYEHNKDEDFMLGAA